MRDLVEGKRGQGEEGEGSSSACGPMVRVGALRDHFVSGLFHHRAPGGCTGGECYLGVLACGSITESKGCPAAAEDRWAPIANRWNLFFVDQYSKTKIVEQWREEAEPCQERS